MRNIQFINAGAGSGKTYTLTAKLAELIKDGKTTPSRVILTTFTKMAAEEFRVKARSMLLSAGLHERAAEMDSATIGTVHSVALGYIQKYWYLLGLGAGVQAMPEEDESTYIGTTLFRVATPEDIAVFTKYADAVPIRQGQSSKNDYDYWKDDINHLVQSAETFGVEDLSRSLEESLALFDDIFMDEPTGETKTLRREVIERMFRIAGRWREEFNRYKKEHNLISYNDMEKLFMELLGNPIVQGDISEGVDYVFVDEFQDSNPTQVRIFDALSDIVAKGSFWVGDPKQAIYDFRGCDTRLTGAVTSVIESRAKSGEQGFGYSVLGESYRSDPKLVELTNKVFVPVFAKELSADKVELTPHNPSVLPDDLPRVRHWSMVPGRTATGRESYSQALASETLAVSVFNLLYGESSVKEVVDKESGALRPLRPSDVAVLCRYSNEVDELANRLRELGVPVSLDLGRDASSVELAFVCAALNYIIGSTNLLEAEIAYMYDSIGVKDLIEAPDKVREREVFARLDALRNALQDKPVSYVVSSVIDALDLERKSSMWGAGPDRLNTLEAVKALAASYESRCIGRGEAATLAGFINTLSSDGVTIDRKTLLGGVNVMTYHKAKGLEWNVVILSTLTDDPLDKKKFFKRNYFGVNVRRLNDPTPKNLYSDFVLRYIPRVWSSNNSSVSDNVIQRIEGRPDVKATRDEIRSEQARLLYVGVTRARDLLITFSPKPEEMGWLKNIGIESLGCKDINGGRGPLWGTGNPKAWIEKMGRDFAEAEIPEAPISCMITAEGNTPKKEKYLSPSSMDGDAAGMSATAVFPKDGKCVRIPVGSVPESQYALLGTCIHNAFAAFRVGDAVRNEAIADRTVEQYGFKDTLPDPAAFVRAWESLCEFLKETYGDPVALYHELPFAYRKGDGQVVTGEMDLVWETADGCVLVDFKNYPGFDDVLDENSKFYVGKYFPQMSCYNEALAKAGKKVLGTLIFYAVQGRIVEIASK